MEAEPPRRIVVLRPDFGQNRYLDNLERLHDGHRQIGHEFAKRRSIASEPVLETGIGIRVNVV